MGSWLAANGQGSAVYNASATGPVAAPTVALQAGRKYSIRVDYTEQTGEAYLKLLWYAPDLGQRIVGSSQLYPS